MGDTRVCEGDWKIESRRRAADFPSRTMAIITTTVPREEVALAAEKRTIKIVYTSCRTTKVLKIY